MKDLTRFESFSKLKSSTEVCSIIHNDFIIMSGQFALCISGGGFVAGEDSVKFTEQPKERLACHEGRPRTDGRHLTACSNYSI